MIIYHCDTCHMEMSGGDKVANGWRVIPEGWTQTELRVPAQGIKLKIHLCSFACMQQFNPDQYVKDWREGKMSIKRKTAPRTNV